MRWLLLILGLLMTLGAGCGACGLSLVSIEMMSHPQSPLWNASLTAGNVARHALPLGRSAAESEYQVELARYVAPYKTAPIACELRVTLTDRQGSRTLVDGATTPRERGCAVTFSLREDTTVDIEGRHVSGDEAVLRIAPHLGIASLPRELKWSWGLVAGLLVLGGAMFVVALKRMSAARRAQRVT